ncbi:hypothetical protein C3L33_23370, partial [Rhododendron williamsianum]
MRMLCDRGYLVGDFELEMTKHQFIQKYGETMKREDLVINKVKRNDSSDQIYVFFPEEQKVGVKTMKTYTNRMKSENVFRAILVEPELLVNIKEHVLVLEHQLLTNKEKKTLLDSFTSTGIVAVFEVMTIVSIFIFECKKWAPVGNFDGRNVTTAHIAMPL